MTSPIPLKLQITRALQALLEVTSGVDELGNPYDLTSSVVRGRSVFGSDSDLPLVAILEALKPDDVSWSGDGSTANVGWWNIIIQGWVSNTRAQPIDSAYFLAAAVESQLSQVTDRDPRNGEAMYPQVFRLGGLISDMRIQPFVVRPPTEGVSATCFFYGLLQLQLAYRPGRPYGKVTG